MAPGSPATDQHTHAHIMSTNASMTFGRLKYCSMKETTGWSGKRRFTSITTFSSSALEKITEAKQIMLRDPSYVLLAERQPIEPRQLLASAKEEAGQQNGQHPHSGGSNAPQRHLGPLRCWRRLTASAAFALPRCRIETVTATNHPKPVRVRGATPLAAATGGMEPSTLPGSPQEMVGLTAFDSSRVWLPELLQRFAARLSPNEVACVLRLVNKAAAALFSGTQDRTVRLSLPVPHCEFARRWSGTGTALPTPTRQQRLQLPCLTARSGSIPNLEVLLARDDDCLTSPLTAEVFVAAGSAGQMEVCQWLREQQGCTPTASVLVAAAEGGHREVCEWLLAGGCAWDSEVAAAAARGGHVSLMDWLLGLGRSCDVPCLLKAAAFGCDLLTLQRLQNAYAGSAAAQVSPLNKDWVLRSAAASPLPDWKAKVEWLESRGYPRNSIACMCDALQQPDWLSRMEWLRQRGYILGFFALHGAVVHGNADVLQYLLAQGFAHGDLHRDLYAPSIVAAALGNLEVLKLLRACGVGADSRTVDAAAKAGHLPIVAWLVVALGDGAPLTPRVFAAAALSGSLELLAWLHGRGCTWDKTVFAAAAEAGGGEQLEWLAERGCPMGEDGTPYVEAAAHVDLPTLRRLHRLGCPWSADGSTLMRAVQRCSSNNGGSGVQALRLLMELGCPDAAAFDSSRVWLPELLHRFAARQSPNEVACVLRLVNKAAAALFSGTQDRTVRLSLLVPHCEFARRWSGRGGAMPTPTWQQRLQLPCLTARSGSIPNLEVLLARDDDCLTSPLTAEVFVAAGSAGQMEVCQWLREQQGCTPTASVLVAAAEGGHRAVCEWLLAGGCAWDSEVAAAAARGGHVSLMDWLLGLGKSFDVPCLLKAAAVGCDLPTLQRVHDAYAGGVFAQLSPLDKDWVLRSAAASPLPDWKAKVEWLESRRYPRGGLAYAGAVERPDWLPRLEWLRQRGYPLAAQAAMWAARHGNADALRHLQTQGIVRDDLYGGTNFARYSQLVDVASSGHVGVLEVLHACGVPIRNELMGPAATAGRLPLLAWLVEALGAGVPLTPPLFAAAALSGNMELLAWLHGRGCTWDKTVFAAAAEAGGGEQLEWLAQRGCPMGEDGAPYVAAAAHVDRPTLRRLHRLGCPWSVDGSTLTRAVQRCAAGGHTGVQVRSALQLLLGLGCPVDWGAAMRAAVYAPKPQGDMVAWLVEQRAVLLADLHDSGVLEHAACAVLRLAMVVWGPVQADVHHAVDNMLEAAEELLSWSKSINHEVAATASLRALLSGRCTRQLVLSSGLVVLCASDGGPSYGLPPELLLRLPIFSAAPGNEDVRYGQGVQVVHERVVHALLGLLVLVGDDPRPQPPPGKRAALAMLLRPAVAAALAGGLLPCLEHHLRHAGRVLDNEASSFAFSLLTSLKLDWPLLAPLLAYGDPRQAAALLATVRKLLCSRGNPHLLMALAWDGTSCPASREACRLGIVLLTFAHIVLVAATEAAVWRAPVAGGGAGGHAAAEAGAALRQLAGLVSYAVREWLPLMSDFVLRAAPALPDAADMAKRAALVSLHTLLCWVPVLARWALTSADAAGAAGPVPAGCWRLLLLEEVRVVQLCGAALGLLPLALSLLRTCAHPACANLAGGSEAELPLQACGGCGAAWYCSRECQTGHWRVGHKEACRFAARLSPNEVACVLRLVNKAAAALFSGTQDKTVRLSLPVPHCEFARRWGGRGPEMPTPTRQQRLQLPCLTARSGSIPNLEVLLARDDDCLISPLTAEVFVAAGSAGQMEVCQWLREQQGCTPTASVLVAAAEGGHREVCEWLLAGGCAWDPEAATAAARGGHVGLMDWLLGLGRIWDVPCLLMAAAVGCDLPTLQRLHHTYVGSAGAQPSPRDKDGVLRSAAASPLPDWKAKVEWLESRGYPRGGLAYAGAVERPDWLPRLEWLQQRGYPFAAQEVMWAAQHGNADALRYLEAQGIVRGDMYGGSNFATNSELVDVASSGHVGVERGCTWDKTVFAAAAEAGDGEQLERLAQRGCPMGDDGAPYVAAAAHVDRPTLRRLHRLGCPWSADGSTFTRAVQRCAAGGHTGVQIRCALQLLLGLGCPVDWGAAVRAALLHGDLVTWLVEQRAAGRWQAAVERAPLPPPPPPPEDACAHPACGAGMSEAKLALCGGCRAARYCSQKCQAEHWRAGHREACGRLARGGGR
ncbi:hypothetical protein TSOC_006988 [Tetrabaena socialis]|uniref:MYND-type domain-containing protein n=1 Tax=Tetrabaena socialis TaxID=47790 RepID=A0A2J8A264_9CHLO|nr:hypothetical protein TSOC_006988 [Tetrabaena socialis]|eukprot:PNH06619.1 hypothetical protein TSOC_006988 [Tetrabaena socialis]